MEFKSRPINGEPLMMLSEEKHYYMSLAFSETVVCWRNKKMQMHSYCAFSSACMFVSVFLCHAHTGEQEEEVEVWEVEMDDGIQTV